MSRIVFYYIQKEAGSSIEHPDCFMLKKFQWRVSVICRNKNITIGDVIDAFPLNRFGRYHLRFRKNEGDSYVWIEPQDTTMPVPFYNGGIFLKVLNLGLVVVSYLIQIKWRRGSHEFLSRIPLPQKRWKSHCQSIVS